MEKTKGRVCLDVIFLTTSKIVKSDDNTDHYQDNLMFLLGSIWHCTHFVHAVSEHEKVVNLGTFQVYATIVPLRKFFTSLVCGLYRANTVVGENVECRLESLYWARKRR